jgi:DNA polymerase IV
MAELDHIEKGCISTIVGGCVWTVHRSDEILINFTTSYRRGKLESNDVDIVFTHPDLNTGAAKVKGLCKRLVRHLYERGQCTTAIILRFRLIAYSLGMVTHVMRKFPVLHVTEFYSLFPSDLSGFHARNTLRTSHRDSIQSALTVFILPPDGNRQRVHRRLDLISAIPKVYWTAVTGW